MDLRAGDDLVGGMLGATGMGRSGGTGGGAVACGAVGAAGPALLDPSCTDGYLVSAYLMEDTGRPDDAIPFYEGAVALAPGNAKIWIELGNTHRRLADEVAARRAYTRALAAAPDHPQAEALRRAVAGE